MYRNVLIRIRPILMRKVMKQISSIAVYYRVDGNKKTITDFYKRKNAPSAAGQPAAMLVDFVRKMK
jgi:hypothetical protein